MFTERKPVNVENISDYLLNYAYFIFIKLGKYYDKTNDLSENELFNLLYFNEENKDILKFIISKVRRDPKDYAAIVFFEKHIQQADIFTKADFFYTIIWEHFYFPGLSAINELTLRSHGISLGDLYIVKSFIEIPSEIIKTIDDITGNFILDAQIMRKTFEKLIEDYFFEDFDDLFENEDDDSFY